MTPDDRDHARALTEASLAEDLRVAESSTSGTSVEEEEESGETVDYESELRSVAAAEEELDRSEPASG